MNINELKTKLQYIISGNVIQESENTLDAARNILCSSFETNTTPQKDFDHQQRIKKEQEKFLVEFAQLNKILNLDFISEDFYLTEGGEAKIYFSKNSKHVIKLNDGIYYSNWLDFLNSICIHNLIFPDTAYTLLGFLKNDETFFTVLKQDFIFSNKSVDLTEIELYLKTNGFEKLRRNDYYNKELSLRLEDIHDENVIKQDD
jgi:Serine/Threonine/Tyrosine Kinase found in polyvalent proteins